ncbi:MAG: thioredoxin [Elusimicrobiaceae bacterium]|jgi:thioredoxin|nr:thioredoxin [Elusimicrobiaceae bacterium]MBT4008096.1 thioredoxin [Elusimicrobiaceae bacterium]MBT4402708.1 thioredoxin [Elusimicrobiaceae bacterium]MBT4440008.1 thioredoxin [Elusimicrobiaceae bacterium]MBT5987408.1 thioredoxin [Elusimicrobiaceae bacterium]
MSELNLTQDTFKKEVLEHDGAVLVDFWAPWCGPCRTLGPIIEELAREYDGKVKITKVNVDENQTLAGEYRVSSIPTILLFKDGKVADQLMGVQDKETLKSKLDSLIEKN